MAQQSACPNAFLVMGQIDHTLALKLRHVFTDKWVWQNIAGVPWCWGTANSAGPSTPLLAPDRRRRQRRLTLLPKLLFRGKTLRAPNWVLKRRISGRIWIHLHSPTGSPVLVWGLTTIGTERRDHEGGNNHCPRPTSRDRGPGPCHGGGFEVCHSRMLGGAMKPDDGYLLKLGSVGLLSGLGASPDPGADVT